MKTPLETGATALTPHVYPQRQAAFYYAGKFMGRFSDQIYLFVLIWYLLTTTHSSIQAGIFLICGTVPVAVISPFSGIIIRRYQRLKLLAALNLFRCILLLIIAGSFYYQFVSIGLLDVGIAILALGGAIYNPVGTSILPNMLTGDQLTPAANEQFWLNTGALAGVLAGGFLYSSVNITLILIISAVALMVATLLECWFPGPAVETRRMEADSGRLRVQPIAGGTGHIPALRAGFSYLNGHRDLFIVIGFFLLANFFLWPVLMIFVPYLFKIVFQLSSLELALAQGAYWAGVVIGIAAIVIEPSKKKLQNTLLTGYISIGILVLLLALPLLPAVKTGLTAWSVTMIDIMLAVFLGLATVFVSLRIGAFIHTRLVPGYRDPIWAIFSLAMAVTGSIGFLIGGYLTQAVPIDLLFIGSAAGILLIAAIMARFDISPEINNEALIQ